VLPVLGDDRKRNRVVGQHPSGDFGDVSTILGTVAVLCAAINAVGGFLITDRMLRMFKKKGGGR